METPIPLIIGFGLIGLLIAALLWWFAIIPWWAIPIGALVLAAIAFAVIVTLFYALWMASGSH